MKKIIVSFAFLLSLLFFYFLIPIVNKPVWAVTEDNCIDAIYYPNTIYENSDNIMFVFVLDKDRADITPNAKYAVKADVGITYPPFQNSYVSEVLTPQDDAGNGKVIRGSIMRPQWSPQYDTSVLHNLTLYRLSSQQPPINLNLGQTPEWDKLNTVYCQKKIEYKVLKPITPTPKLEKCELIPPAKNITITDDVEIIAKVDPNPQYEFGTTWYGIIKVFNENDIEVNKNRNDISDKIPTSFPYKLGTLDKPGEYLIKYEIFSEVAPFCQSGTCPPISTYKGSCQIKMKVAPIGGIGGFITLTPTPIVTAIPTQTMWAPTYTPTPVIVIPTLGPLCDQLANKDDDTDARHPHKDCMDCVDPKPSPNITPVPGIWTAIGCLPTDYGELISGYVFKTGIGIAGGISFLYFLYGAFLILTSAGNPEKIEEAKQIIISALSGLLLIIFSIFLLRVIGVDILRIPDFK